jgi:exoribonuclease R
MDPYRRLVYRFFTLPHLDQQRIIGELGLASDTDQGLDTPARYSRCLAKARERNQLAKLWDAVERSHPEASTTPNPFSHT